MADELDNKVEALSLEQASTRVELKNIVASLQALATKFDLLSSHVAAGRSPNWGVLAAFGGLMFTLVGMAGTAAWFTITQNVTLQMSPINGAVGTLNEILKFQREVYEEKFKVLGAKQDADVDKIGELEHEVSELTIVVTTNEQIRNLNEVNQQRWNSVMWNTIPGNEKRPYPTFEYYPQIAAQKADIHTGRH